MIDSPRRGDTFLIQTGGSENEPDYHCFCVATGPLGDPPEMLLVSFSTVRNSVYDDSCILQPDDHPFIKSISFVSYEHARILRVSQITNGIRSNQFKPRPPVSEALLARIAAGFTESIFVSPRIRRFYLEDRAAG